MWKLYENFHIFHLFAKTICGNAVSFFDSVNMLGPSMNYFVSEGGGGQKPLILLIKKTTKRRERGEIAEFDTT